MRVRPASSQLQVDYLTTKMLRYVLEYWTYVYLASFLLGVKTKDPPVVNIPDQGEIGGREVLLSRQRALLYLGIPFAAPPLGQLRFAAPQTDPLPTWSDVRNGSMFPPACLQRKDHLKKEDRLLTPLMPEDKLEFSEDCLYLNIFAPDGASPTEGWPVMVWFHSGDFSSGTTSVWDGSILAIKQKVMVVTVGYRLNVFGFFTLTDGHSSGNYGLLDQVAALDWISTKISAFGGSPADVCLFGQGAGGISVGLHVVSPLSAGKFSRAIAMSGNAGAPGAVKDASMLESYVKKLGETFYCETTSARLLECMRSLDGSTLALEATELGEWGPVVDRDLNTTRAFLPDTPAELLERGTFNHVAFMAGFTDMEDALISGSNLQKGLTRTEFEDLIMEAIKVELPEPLLNDTCPINHAHILDTIAFYYSPQPPSTDPMQLRTRFLDFATDKKYASGAFLQAVYTSKFMPTFLYRFDYKAKSFTDIPEWVKVPHQYELPFVWGMPYWTSLSLIWNGADRKMADSIMILWANFAKTGNTASQTGLTMKWDTFTEEIPVIMILDRVNHMSDIATFDYKAFAFWNNYYPKVVEASTVCCNSTTGGGTALRATDIPSTTLALIAFSYLWS